MTHLWSELQTDMHRAVLFLGGRRVPVGVPMGPRHGVGRGYSTGGEQTGKKEEATSTSGGEEESMQLLCGCNGIIEKPGNFQQELQSKVINIAKKYAICICVVNPLQL